MPRYTLARDSEFITTHDVEHDHTVIRTTQFNYDAVMARIAEKRKAGEDQRGFLGGYMVGSIPINDIPFVRKKYPELFSPEADKELKAKALVRFSNDSEMRPYLVKRA